MIDISLNHAAQCVGGFHEDWLEHNGWDTEFYALDLTQTDQALYAIKKWLTSAGNPNGIDLTTYIYQTKEACRYCLTKGFPFGDVWLPGISGIGTGFDQPENIGDMEKWEKLSTDFHLLLWSELFPDEPYKPAVISQYRQRVDQSFVNFPHLPELWGEPVYKPW